MSLRKLEGGGAACAYCGFALVMEGPRQCCPAGRDYDALQRERDEAVEYGTRTRREWQRECEDTNLMLQGLGLCPSEYRSEGGSLMLGRIQHAFKKREASIVAERDEAVALLRWADAMVNDFPETYLIEVNAFLNKLEGK